MSEVVNNETARRFEMTVDGHTGFLNYAKTGSRIELIHTEVPPELGGRGIGGALAKAALDYAQQAKDGRLFVGGGRDRFVDTEWTFDTSPTPGVQGYIERVAERMAGKPVDVVRRWGASVSYTTDGRPLCSEVLPGVIAIGAYNGTGNLVGPVAARAAVALALDSTTPPEYFSD